MKQLFIKNLGFVIALNVLVKPLWMYTEIRVINKVGPEVFGEYFALFGFALLLQIILDMGISNFNNRNISQHNQLINKYLPNILTLKLLLAGCYFVLTAAFAFVWKYEWVQIKLILLLGFNQVLQSYMLYYRSNLAGLRYYMLDSFFSIFDRFLAIILVSLLLMEGFMESPFQIEWFIYAQTIALSISALLITVLVLKNITRLKINIKLPFLLLVIKQTYPYALLGILMSIYTRIDAVMIERMLPNGSEQTGIYASAYRLLDICTMYCFLFASLLLPIFSRLLKNKESIQSIATFSFKSMVVPAILLSITCSYFSKSIMDQLFYIGATDEYYKIFRILILSFPAIASQYIFGTLLTANGNLKLLNKIAIVSLFINISLNYVLIQYQQALGATIATFITQYFVAICQLLVLNKYFKITAKVRDFIKITSLVIILLCLNQFFPTISSLWFINFAIIIGLGGIAAITLGLIDIRSILHMIKTKQESQL